MDVDPLASMRCWAIELELGGRTYDVPALPAVDWWPILVSGNLADVLDLVVLTPEESSNLDDLLLSGEVDGGELGQVLTDAVETAAGRSLHSAMVLATMATMHWPNIGGALAVKGFRWDVASISAALDAIHSVVVSSLDKENADTFLAFLDNESATTPGKVSPKVVDQFESLAGPRPTAGVKSTGVQSGSARPKTRQRPRQPRPAAPSNEPRQPPGPPAESDPAASS